MHRRRFLSSLCLPALPAVVSPARAQGTPLRLLVGSTAGGIPDVLNRELAQALAVALERPVVVENKPSAGGVLALSELKRSVPDGNTVAAVFWAQLSVTPGLMPALPYRPLEDFEFMGTWISGPQVLVARADAPYRSIAELVDQARRSEPPLQFASPGMVSPGHVFGELFKQVTQVPLQHVPYRGAAAVTGVLRGDVSLLVTGVEQVLPHVQAGVLRPLAVFSNRQVPALPEVPTSAALGLVGLDRPVWHGFLAPKGTPTAFVERFGAALRSVVETPAFRRAHEAVGRVIDLTTPAQMRDRVAREMPEWAEIVRKAGITMQ